jgi:glycogen operon protein
MSEHDWGGNQRSLGIFLNGKAIPTPDEKGQQIFDDDFFVLINAHHEPATFRLPDDHRAKKWLKIIDTAAVIPERRRQVLENAEAIDVAPRGMVVLQAEG